MNNWHSTLLTKANEICNVSNLFIGCAPCLLSCYDLTCAPQCLHFNCHEGNKQNGFIACAF